MIVLKHNGLVYIAISQCFHRSSEAVRNGKPNAEDLKAYHPKRRKNQLIATNGISFITEPLRYEDIFPEELNMKSLVLDLFPNLCKINKFFGQGDGFLSTVDMVFAQDSDAFVLFRDGTCLEIEDIFACGINSDTAIALYDSEKIEDPNDFFKKAFTVQEELYGSIMFPIAVLNTGSNKISTINRR